MQITHFRSSPLLSSLPRWSNPLDQANIDATGFVDVGLPFKNFKQQVFRI